MISISNSFNDGAIAIGGLESVIKPFMEAAKQAHLPAYHLEFFRCFQLVGGLTIFAYSMQGQWTSEYDKNTWQELCDLADKFKLSWVLYWVTEGLKGAQVLSNHKAEYFDKQMLQLFDLQVHPITVKHPKLAQLI